MRSLSSALTSPVPRYLAKRVLGALVALLTLAVVVFVLVKLIPGDEARVAAGPAATPEQVEAIRESRGLNRPLPIQFLDYLGRLARGDLGTSSTTQVPVATEIAQVLPTTLQLVAVAMILIIVVDVPLTLLSAARSGQASDRATSIAVIFGSALPAFWLALLAQHWLGSEWRLFPISGAASSTTQIPRRTGFSLADAVLAGDLAAFGDVLIHLILPATILAIGFGAQFYRALRAELLRVLQREFVTLASAKGLPSHRTMLFHVLPNAAGPALTLLGVIVGTMVGAAILIETVFGLPGIGSYITAAVDEKDLYAVLGGVLVIGVVVIGANLVADLLQLVRDPRLRSADLEAS
jgi:dipeptide transport system permease protein